MDLRNMPDPLIGGSTPAQGPPMATPNQDGTPTNVPTQQAPKPQAATPAPAPSPISTGASTAANVLGSLMGGMAGGSSGAKLGADTAANPGPAAGLLGAIAGDVLTGGIAPAVGAYLKFGPWMRAMLAIGVQQVGMDIGQIPGIAATMHTEGDLDLTTPEGREAFTGRIKDAAVVNGVVGGGLATAVGAYKGLGVAWKKMVYGKPIEAVLDRAATAAKTYKDIAAMPGLKDASGAPLTGTALTNARADLEAAAKQPASYRAAFTSKVQSYAHNLFGGAPGGSALPRSVSQRLGAMSTTFNNFVDYLAKGVPPSEAPALIGESMNNIHEVFDGGTAAMADTVAKHAGISIVELSPAQAVARDLVAKNVRARGSKAGAAATPKLLQALNEGDLGGGLTNPHIATHVDDNVMPPVRARLLEKHGLTEEDLLAPKGPGVEPPTPPAPEPGSATFKAIGRNKPGDAMRLWKAHSVDPGATETLAAQLKGGAADKAVWDQIDKVGAGTTDMRGAISAFQAEHEAARQKAASSVTTVNDLMETIRAANKSVSESLKPGATVTGADIDTAALQRQSTMLSGILKDHFATILKADPENVAGNAYNAYNALHRAHMAGQFELNALAGKYMKAVAQGGGSMADVGSQLYNAPLQVKRAMMNWANNAPLDAAQQFLSGTGAISDQALTASEASNIRNMVTKYANKGIAQSLTRPTLTQGILKTAMQSSYLDSILNTAIKVDAKGLPAIGLNAYASAINKEGEASLREVLGPEGTRQVRGFLAQMQDIVHNEMGAVGTEVIVFRQASHFQNAFSEALHMPGKVAGEGMTLGAVLAFGHPALATAGAVGTVAVPYSMGKLLTSPARMQKTIELMRDIYQGGNMAYNRIATPALNMARTVRIMQAIYDLQTMGANGALHDPKGARAQIGRNLKVSQPSFGKER